MSQIVDEPNKFVMLIPEHIGWPTVDQRLANGWPILTNIRPMFTCCSGIIYYTVKTIYRLITSTDVSILNVVIFSANNNINK